jgi:DNA mismatch repair ATPase MutS
MVITGANGSGKSFMIKSLLINILFAQTIGVCCCQSIVLTPFANMYTYINIPNIVRDKQSLFEAEITQCMEICTAIENLPENLFCFIVIDELFTGTNPKEGISSSYAVCEYLNSFNNSLMMLTTHFTELTELGDKHPDKFDNKQFTVIRDINGGFYKPYTLQDGVSDQYIAIELLKQKGYNTTIINRALEKLKELN